MSKDGQELFLARIEEIQKKAKEADEEISYADAYEMAQEQYPEDYAAYLADAGYEGGQ